MIATNLASLSSHQISHVVIISLFIKQVCRVAEGCTKACGTISTSAYPAFENNRETDNGFLWSQVNRGTLDAFQFQT